MLGCGDSETEDFHCGSIRGWQSADSTQIPITMQIMGDST
jgi:hypothetical protein